MKTPWRRHGTHLKGSSSFCLLLSFATAQSPLRSTDLIKGGGVGSSERLTDNDLKLIKDPSDNQPL